MGAVLPRTMSPRPRGAGGKSSVDSRLPNRADVYVRRDTVKCEICYFVHLEIGLDGCGIYIYVRKCDASDGHANM